MTLSVVAKIVNTLDQNPGEWPSYSALYGPVRDSLNGPHLQKLLMRLARNEVLEMRLAGGLEFRARPPRPSREPSAEELHDLVLESRVNAGLATGAALLFMRQAIQRRASEVLRQAEAAAAHAELKRQLAEIERRRQREREADAAREDRILKETLIELCKKPPEGDLTLDDVKRLIANRD